MTNITENAEGYSTGDFYHGVIHVFMPH